MRLTRNLFATLILSTLVCGSVMAQPPEREGGRRRGPGGAGGPGLGGPGGPGGGPGAFMRMIPIIAALDADEDGTISSEEIANASVALKKLDKNKDGKLTAEEIMPERGRRGPGGPGGAGGPGGRPGAAGGPGGRPGGAGGRGGEFLARMFEQRDANKDGKLSGDEIPEQMAGRMERIDSNGDKAISKAELEAAMSRGGGRQRGGDQGGRPGGERPRRPQAEDDK